MIATGSNYRCYNNKMYTVLWIMPLEDTGKSVVVMRETIMGAFMAVTEEFFLGRHTFDSGKVISRFWLDGGLPEIETGEVPAPAPAPVAAVPKKEKAEKVADKKD